ncbi:hypothetical protein [Aeromonas salmonicida]
MISAENRLKCVEFKSYPTLARAPAADLFNMVLDDGLLVWPALGITIPLDEVPYEAIINAWASDSERPPIDVDLPADRPPVIEERDLWPDEQSTPENDLLTTHAER